MGQLQNKFILNFVSQQNKKKLLFMNSLYKNENQLLHASSSQQRDAQLQRVEQRNNQGRVNKSQRFTTSETLQQFQERISSILSTHFLFLYTMRAHCMALVTHHCCMIQNAYLPHC